MLRAPIYAPRLPSPQSTPSVSQTISSIGRLGEIRTTVHADVGSGHVGVAPRREESGDRSNLFRQAGPGHLRRMTEMLGYGVHQRIGIVAVDTHRLRPADQRL